MPSSDTNDNLDSNPKETTTTSASASSPTAAATSSSPSSDFRLAQELHTIQQLVTIFQYTYEQAEDAVTNVGPDVTKAYNYILDQGGDDKGGAIFPIHDCPHLEKCLAMTNNDILGFNFQTDDVCTYFDQEEVESSHSSNNDSDNTVPVVIPVAGSKRKSEMVDGKCPNGENWICLTCNAVRCSRYINGHCKDHWVNTKAAEMNQYNNNDIKGTCSTPIGHCIALSLQDLSVWCYECNAYLVHKKLDKVVKEFENMKFSIHEKEKERKRIMDEEQSTIRNSNHNHNVNEDRESNISDEDANHEQQSNIEEDDNKSNNSESDSSNEEKVEFFTKKQYSLNTQHPYLPTNLQDLANFIKSDDCQSIVILAGAGMSRSSGIPDFRSAGGLYDSLRPETLTCTTAQMELMRSDPTAVFDRYLFLENPLPCLECKRPFILGIKQRKWKATLAHRFVELLHDKTGKLTRLYTQNIDGLEAQCDKLPKDSVIPVHGSMDRVACELPHCQAEMDYDEFCDNIQSNIKDITGTDDTAPSTSSPIMCKACQNYTVKPTVVLFHSPLPEIFFQSIIEDLPYTDLLIVIGTSLTVGPANSIVYRVPDDCLRVVVNNEPVGYRLGIDYSDDPTRDFFARGSCDEVLLELMDKLGWMEDVESLSNDLPDSSKELLQNYLNQE